VLEPSSFLAIRIEPPTTRRMTEHVMHRSEHVVLGVTQVRMRVAGRRAGEDLQAMLTKIVQHRIHIGVRIIVHETHGHTEAAKLQAANEIVKLA